MSSSRFRVKFWYLFFSCTVTSKQSEMTLRCTCKFLPSESRYQMLLVSNRTDLNWLWKWRVDGLFCITFCSWENKITRSWQSVLNFGWKFGPQKPRIRSALELNYITFLAKLGSDWAWDRPPGIGLTMAGMDSDQTGGISTPVLDYR